MHLHKGKAEISVVEAVDNLSHMAEIDLSVPEGPEKPLELTEEQNRDRINTISWHAPEYFSYNRERVKDTFGAITKYLKDLFEKDKAQLKDEEVQRGVQAIMLLAAEAAQKVDNYTEIFKEGGESVVELGEYKELQHFYLTKIVPNIPKVVEAEGKWHEEWGAGVEEDKIGVHKGGLKDLESIRADKEYELFLIRREDGHPFFNRSLLHHLQLIGQFDFMFRDPTRENPLSRVPMIQDRDAHHASREILHLASAHINEFYKEALKFKQMGFVSEINKALMALMLSANTRNLMQTAIGKSSLSYYSDFRFYLRRGLQTKEYQRFISHPPDQSERFLNALINLSHVLCTSFFLRTINKKEMTAFIRMLIERGAKDRITQSQTSSPLSMWNALLDQDDNIRHLLKQHPNGPLLMALRLFTKENQLRGFDPIAQQNYTGLIYTMSGEGIYSSCIRLPSPTLQQFLNKADIIEEFCGFLRDIGSPKKSQKHLLINFQDRTSWLEHARCAALEGLPKDSEFSKVLISITLPKNTDFYMQTGNYFDQNGAKEFKKEFKEQIASAEQCGFYFPQEVDQKALLKFTDDALNAIHSVFFADKETLVHKNRLDFIEIFYLILTLKLMEIFKPDTFSFTSKDAIDVGATESAAVFAFLRMMNDSSPWSKAEKDLLLWMLYAPALAVRERVIDVQQMNRMTSALCAVNAELEAHSRQVIDACSKLYQIPFFKGLKFQEDVP